MIGKLALVAVIWAIGTPAMADCKDTDIVRLMNDGEVVTTDDGAVYRTLAGRKAPWLPGTEVRVCRKDLNYRGRDYRVHEISGPRRERKVAAVKLN